MGFQTTKKVSDVAAHVKRQFGDESGVQVTDADIIRWINAAQVEIVSANQSLKGVGTINSVSGDYDYDLDPTMNVQYINSVHYNGVKLGFKSFHDAEEYITSQDPDHVAIGIPEFWYSWAGELNLYPTPNETGKQIKVYYRPLPTDVTALADFLGLPDNYYNRIIEHVMASAFEMDENFQAHNVKMQQFNVNLLAMSEDENIPQVDTYSVISVRPEDI